MGKVVEGPWGQPTQKIGIMEAMTDVMVGLATGEVTRVRMEIYLATGEVLIYPSALDDCEDGGGGRVLRS